MKADGTPQILSELRIEPDIEECIISMVCPKCESVVENQRPFPSQHCSADVCTSELGSGLGPFCSYLADCCKATLQHKIDCPVMDYLKEGRPDIKWDELLECYLSREISPENEVVLRARGRYTPRLPINSTKLE